MSLQLRAIEPKTKSPLQSLDVSPVTAASPSIPVRAGQILRIRGRVQIPRPLTATMDGLLIYDSLVGTAGALRFQSPARAAAGRSLSSTAKSLPRRRYRSSSNSADSAKPSSTICRSQRSSRLSRQLVQQHPVTIPARRQGAILRQPSCLILLRSGPADSAAQGQGWRRPS